MTPADTDWPPESVADKTSSSQLPRLAFLAAPSKAAQEARRFLEKIYSFVDVAHADIVVALGGDGFMLQTLKTTLMRDVPVYGMNLGTIGFLMNPYHGKNLYKRLAQASSVLLHPLKMVARTRDGREKTLLALNEVSLLRETHQAAKICVTVDHVVRLDEVICDGILLSTPAGSTAYNLSAHGPIVPLGAELLALTPISPFRPRRWRGALLPFSSQVHFKVLEWDKRPVSAVADATEVRHVNEVFISLERSISWKLLFDPGHDLEERILREQFSV